MTRAPRTHPFSRRQAGVLLHITSLPGPLGHGDMGPQAHSFAKWLAQCGLSLWQTLPLNPPGPGQSPYSSWSAFAGNPFLISPETLFEWGLLGNDQASLWAPDRHPSHKAHPKRGQQLRWRLLSQGALTFLEQPLHPLQKKYQEFCQSASWLEEVALFWCLWQHHKAPWWLWPLEHRHRDPEALRAFAKKKEKQIDLFKIQQFFFQEQLFLLKQTCEDLGVDFVGDMPIYVDHCSADVWAHQEGFQLDSQGMPVVVSGVPPDDFCTEGQRWGTPIFRWQSMTAWWQKRFKRSLEMAHVVRLDHFRGLASYWAVPARDPTAAGGKWEVGPGDTLLNALRDVSPHLPIVAEDLGYMTPDVHALRDTFRLPGMKILQFAFDGNGANEHLPHNHSKAFWVYTGTHDNPTTKGWLGTLNPKHRLTVTTYLGLPPRAPDTHIVQALVRAAFGSVAQATIIPMQDFLNLGASHRMNTPGTVEGNWLWRMKTMPHQEVSDTISRLVSIYSRGS